MAGSDDAPDATQWRKTSKFYVRYPGLPWLIGLIVIPLLLAVIGYGALGRIPWQATGPTGALPTLHVPNPSAGAPNTPTIPAVFSSAAATTGVLFFSIGIHLSAFRLIPPPAMNSSGHIAFSMATSTFVTCLAHFS